MIERALLHHLSVFSQYTASRSLFLPASSLWSVAALPRPPEVSLVLFSPRCSVGRPLSAMASRALCVSVRAALRPLPRRSVAPLSGAVCRQRSTLSRPAEPAPLLNTQVQYGLRVTRGGRWTSHGGRVHSVVTLGNQPQVIVLKPGWYKVEPDWLVFSLNPGLRNTQGCQW